MRFLYALALIAVFAAPASAQRNSRILFPELCVDAANDASELDACIYSFNDELPAPYYPQEPGTPLPGTTTPALYVGYSAYYRVVAEGDTLDLAPSYSLPGVSGQVVVARKADGTEALGCVDANPNPAPDWANQADFAGKIVMVRRGVCSFIFKSVNAAAAGALAVVVYNGDDREGPTGTLADVVGGMSAAPEYTGNPLTIQSILIPNGIAQPIIDETVAGGTVTLLIRPDAVNNPTAAEPTVGTTQSGLEIRGSNPFTTATTLRVFTEQTEAVRLEVFNVRGQLVQTLLNGVVSGERSVRFASEGLAPGVYFVRATGETFRSQQQLTIVR